MTLKNRIKYGIIAVGHVPWVARFAGIPSVQRVLLRLPGGKVLYRPCWERLHPFDRLHDIETSSGDKIDAHLADQPAYAHAHSYAGSQPGLLRAVLTLLPGLHNRTFVDLGCGKGRPLFVATEFSFRDIVGVEFSPRLAGIAQENAARMTRRYPTRTPVRVEIGDAGAYTFPAGDIVLFLYNPFGEDIIRRVVRQLEAALAAERRSLYVVYYNPVFGAAFEASPALGHVFTRTIPYDREEQGFAWGTEDTVAVWRGGSAPALDENAVAKLGRDPRTSLSTS